MMNTPITTAVRFGLGFLLACLALVGTSAPARGAANELYRVKADLDGRTAPRLNARAPGATNYLRAGQRVKITCQARGQNVKGNAIWDMIGGYYVPDYYISTGTNGFLRGVRRCRGYAPASTPRPPARKDVQRCRNNSRRIALPGKADIALEVHLCVIRFASGYVSTWAQMGWHQVGFDLSARRFDRFGLAVRLERAGREITGRTKDRTRELNRSAHGPQGEATWDGRIAAPDQRIRRGSSGWAAAGEIVFDIDNDGRGAITWKLEAPPSV